MILATRTRTYLGLVAVLLTVVVTWQVYRATHPRANPPTIDIYDSTPELADMISQLRAEVCSAPKSDVAWGQLGAVFLANRFYAQAAESFCAAAELNDAEWHWWYLAAVAKEQGDLSGEMQYYQRAAILNPDYVPLLIRYGLTLERNSEAAAAREVWQRALELAPRDYDGNLGLGRLALARQDTKAAIEYFQTAVAVAPLEREAHIALIPVFFRLGNSAKVSFHQQQLARCHPEDTRLPDPLLEEIQQFNVTAGFVSLARQANQLLAIGDLKGFIDVSERLVQMKPEYSNTRINLGTALGEMGYRDQALAVLREAVREFPDTARAHYNLGVVLSQGSDGDEAMECFRTAAKLKPDFTDAHFNLGVQLSKRGRRHDAVEAFQKAIAASSDHADAHLQLAETFRALDQKEQASRHFNLVLQLRPDDEYTLKALADLGETP